MRAVAFDQIGPHIVKAEHLRIDQRPYEIIGGRRARIVDEVRDFLLKAGPGFHRDRIAPEGCAVGFPDDAALDEKVPSCAFPPGEAQFAKPGQIRNGETEMRHTGHLIKAALGETIIRSEEHTSELQSLMRISYALFCLTNKRKKNNMTR